MAGVSALGVLERHGGTSPELGSQLFVVLAAFTDGNASKEEIRAHCVQRKLEAERTR